MLLGMPSITPALHPAGRSAERAQPAAVLPHPPPQPEEVEGPGAARAARQPAGRPRPVPPTAARALRGPRLLYGHAISSSSPRSARFWTPSSRARCPPGAHVAAAKPSADPGTTGEPGPATEMSDAALGGRGICSPPGTSTRAASREARAGFAALQQAKAPWVAESATYMVMRTEINLAMKEAKDEYGDRDVTRSDKGPFAAPWPRVRPIWRPTRKGATPARPEDCSDASSGCPVISAPCGMPMTRPWQPASPCRAGGPGQRIDLTLLSGDAYRHQAAYQDSAQPALLFVNAPAGSQTDL